MSTATIKHNQKPQEKWLAENEQIIQQASWKIIAELDRLQSGKAETQIVSLIKQFCKSILERCEDQAAYIKEREKEIEELKRQLKPKKA